MMARNRKPCRKPSGTNGVRSPKFRPRRTGPTLPLHVKARAPTALGKSDYRRIMTAQSGRSSAYKSCELCLSHISPPRSAGPRVARTGHAHSPGTPLLRARHPTAFHIRRQRHLGCCRAPQSTSHLFKHTTVPTPHRPVQNCIIVTFSLASLMLTLTSLGLDGLSSGGGGGGGLVLPSTPAASAPGTRQERTPPLASAVQRSFS